MYFRDYHTYVEKLKEEEEVAFEIKLNRTYLFLHTFVYIVIKIRNYFANFKSFPSDINLFFLSHRLLFIWEMKEEKVYLYNLTWNNVSFWKCSDDVSLSMKWIKGPFSI